MKKVMMVFGTRPEAIKMCPLVHALRAKNDLQTVVCVTGQHREMLDSVLDTFSVTPDYDLAVMTNRQTLASLTERVLHRVSEVLERERPDAVLVHGDTASAFCAALASFYLKIPVCHVEAGLRTYDIRAPFPEELYREAISLMASLHFAPTARARDNLLREGKDARRVFVTGNTAIDALGYTVRADFSHPLLDKARGKRLLFFFVKAVIIIILTNKMVCDIIPIVAKTKEGKANGLRFSVLFNKSFAWYRSCNGCVFSFSS